MKPYSLIFTAFLTILLLACNSQPANKEVEADSGNSDKIEAYYFHFTARCMTCRTIEARFKENLETLYPNQMEHGLITFESVNIEQPENKPLADKLGVSGQTLLIVKGRKKINLTNEGFMYAVVRPDRFREIINEKVDGLMIK